VGRSRVLAGALLVLLAAGCTDDGGDGVATVDGGTPAPSGPATDPVERERQFVACMRGRGVDMPDPVPGDRSGRSALLHAIDVQGKGSDPAFQEALDACTTFLPPAPPPEPPEAVDLTRMLEFAKCMRDNGLPDFPDPDADGRIIYTGGTTAVGSLRRHEGRVIVVENPTTEAALGKCRQLIPPLVTPSAGPS